MDTILAGNIFLTGFMGAGKSTVGRQLAVKLSCRFVDLDCLIEETVGKTIPDIFSEWGENSFRQLESKTLMGLPDDQTCVYATGGGIVMSEDNRKFMHSTGCIVYLNADWQTLRSRLSGSTGRPLISQGKDWTVVRELYEKRLPAYADADLVVNTDDKSVEDVVSEILKELARL